MSRTFSRILVAVLVLTMLVGMTAVAQASPPSWAKQGKDSKHYSHSFGDISLEDFPWAFKHIEKMSLKGFIKGVGNGVFNGNAPIKHEEAVTMVVRYKDLEDEAQAAMGATLPFSDANKISSWARGYVKVALGENLLWMPDSSQMTKFDPTTPTTRVEAIVMLVKAAGLEDEAEAKMSQKLTFKDAASIPAGYVGYVAVGVAEGLVAGYDDNTFQPFKPVRRAEMATFLGRADDSFPIHHGDDDIEGKFVSATASTITVSRKGQNTTYTLIANCPVYLDDEMATLADLKAGDEIELELDSTGKVVFIDAERDDDDDDDDDDLPATLAGVVKSVSLSSTSSTIVVTLASNAGDKTFTIAPNCVIKVDGVTVTAADIKVGDNVTIKLLSGTGDQLIEIIIVRNQTTAVAGVVKGLMIGLNSQITIRPDSQTSDVTYGLATNCVVKVNGTASSLTGAEIVVGDRVELKLAAGKVSEINVIRAQTTTVSGTVQSVTINTGTPSRITVRLNNQTSDTNYLIAADAVVKYNGNTVALTEVKGGDKVTLTLLTQSGVPLVTKIDIASRETVASGTVTGVNYDARTLTVVKNSVTTTYSVAANVVVTLLDQPFTWNQVTLNDAVTLTLVDGTVTKINVTVHNASYTGTVKSVTVDATGNHFVATISGTDRTVDVPTTAVITHAGQPGTFADVTVGATVTITGAFDGTKIVAGAIAVQ